MKNFFRKIGILITIFSVFFFYVGTPAAYAALGSKSTTLSGAQYWGLQSGSQSGINIAAGNDFSVSVWLNPSSSFTGGNQFGMGVWGTSTVPPASSGPNNSYLMTIQTTPLIILNDKDGDGCAVTGAVLTVGSWTNIVATYNHTTGHMNFYQNGTQLGVTQNCATGGPGGVSGQMNIGYMTSNAAYYSGSIWDARIYRSELSAGNISSYYSSPCTFSSSGLNLVGEWAFNGDGTDLSGNANTLTNNGGATFSTTPTVPAVCSSGSIFNFSLFQYF